MAFRVSTGGKRRAQPSGNAEGKAAANGDAAVLQGGASRKRQTRGLSVGGAAGSEEAASRQEGLGSILAADRSSGQEESGSSLQPMTMCFSVRFDAGNKAALEAAVRKAVTECGGRGFGVEWMRGGPSDDTLQRVLSFVLERVGLEGAAQCFQVCKAWRRELEARGFCKKNVQLCTLADGGNIAHLEQIALQRFYASTGEAERALCLNANSFLQRSWWWAAAKERSLHEWLQAASQEPDASFLSRGAASTAEILGLQLVPWVGKPQGRHLGFRTLKGHSALVNSVAIATDDTRIVTGSDDRLAKIWDVATGAEICTLRHSNIVRSVAFSTDGKRVVCGCGDKLVTIWNAATGALILQLGEHSGKGICRCTATKWGHYTIHPECVAGHSDTVLSVAYSPDGKHVGSGSSDTRVKMWDAATNLRHSHP